MRTHNPFCIPLSIAVAVILVAAMICFRQHAFGQQLTQQGQPVPAEVDMRWKFAPDDIIRVEMRVDETVVDDQNNQFQNERIYDYRWTVESVDPEGTAIITVTFDRIRFRSEWSNFEFDSLTDNPMAGRVGDDAKANALVYEFRGMVSSRFMIEVTSLGAVRQIEGAESVVGPSQFLPSDFPALPEEHVKVGDSWSVDTGSRAGFVELRGDATYKLARLERNGEQLICHLQGENVSPEVTGLPADTQLGPVASVSRFDPEAGRFLDEELKSRIRAEIAPGQIVNLSVDATRRLFPSEKRVDESVKSGEYIIYFDGEGPHPAVLAGLQVGTPAGNVSKIVELRIFHRWTDADQDGNPAPDELTGVTTRFTSDESVRFHLLAVGTQDAKMRMDLVGTHGERLLSSRIPIKGDGGGVAGVLPDLGPGVYFVELFVNDRHLVRIPVQVYFELEEREAERVPDDIQVLVQRGLTHLFEKRVDEAIRHFSHAIEAMPNEAQLYVFRGSAQNKKADYDAAIADFTRAVQLNPELADALAYRGYSWLEKGDDAKALADFDTAVELDPDCEVAFANRGSFWLQRGEYARALADYKQAMQINPSRDAILNAVAEIRAACPDARYRDGDEALRFARHACMNSEWENYEYLATLAAAYAEVGDFESAIRWQQRSVDKAPSELQDEGQQRLDLYRAGKPYRTEKI